MAVMCGCGRSACSNVQKECRLGSRQKHRVWDGGGLCGRPVSSVGSFARSILPETVLLVASACSGPS